MAEIKEGPRTSHREFFEEHVNLEIPELSGIKEALGKDDIPAADKIFADYMRKSPDIGKLTAAWKREVQSLSGDRKESFIKKARDIMDYHFVSCGIPYHFADHKVDWEFNPTYNGYKEWPWQLSRHPEFSHLAKYYLLTGDENAAKTYSDMLTGWIRQAVVPENVGGGATVCWRTIEAGIRLMTWHNQMYSMINSPMLSDSVITEFFISVYEHGWRLRNFCMHGNWLIMEMHGLIRVAMLDPFLKDSKEWYDFALDRLCKELDIQVYPDGFQYELSTNYHSVVDGNYLGVLSIFGILGVKPPVEITQRLEKAFEVYPHLTRPDRRLPDLNDGNEMTIRGKMQAAVGLYPDRDDFRWFATDGAEGKEPDYLSYAFPYAGSVVMRSDWSKDAIWAYMDASPFGRGHQHEDKLNVLLNAYGKKLLTEGGCYDYDSSEMRKYVLSTRAHNTVMIDGKEQNCRARYKWADEEINKKADLTFEITPERETAEASYTDGYGADFDSTVHTRKLIFIKDAEKYGLLPFFVVVDRFSAPDDRERKYESMWHFENCEFEYKKGYACGDYGDGVGLIMAFSDEQAETVNMQGQHEPYYQGFMPIRPSGPHEHRPIPTPVNIGKFSGAYRTVTVLYPYKDGRKDIVAVKASTDVSDKSLTLVTSDGKEFTVSEL